MAPDGVVASEAGARRGGVVTRALLRLVAAQVGEHGVVVWYDPERHYGRLVERLAADAAAGEASPFGGAKLARYDGSIFALRAAVDPSLESETPPRLLVYAPIEPAALHDGLIELEALGVTLLPGAEAPERNTRLGVVAGAALREVLGEEALGPVLAQAGQGKLTLEELDQLAEQGRGLAGGALALIFGNDHPADVALRFLCDEALDAELTAKGAVGDLATLLARYVGLPAAPSASAGSLRAALARHVLLADLLAALADAAPPTLSALAAGAQQPAARSACAALARAWRQRDDLREGYVGWADRVEAALPLRPQGAGASQGDVPPRALARVETFRATEEQLQAAVEAALLGEGTDAGAPPLDAAAALALARARQGGVWARSSAEIAARWALIAAAGQTLLEASRVAVGLKGPGLDALALFQAYTDSLGGDSPWCLLDTAHRHLERLAYEFDFAADDRQAPLEALIARARARAMAVASNLASAFVHAYRDANFDLPGVRRQRDIFQRHVRPALATGQTAYLLVDALRFEMARELLDGLGPRFTAALRPALATPPTITAVGMAALLPGADGAFTLARGGADALSARLDGQPLRLREERVDYVAKAADGEACVLKLDDLLHVRPTVRAKIKRAALIVVTSQEIDELGERGNTAAARAQMEGALRDLRRAVRALADLGVRTIVISADHGHLFGEALESDARIEPPGGDTVKLNRRVWVGVGGAANPAYLRARLAEFGVGGDLELATPWNLACFKAPGGLAYMHGGLSPQEVIIPVATLTVAAGAGKGARSSWELALRPGSPTLSTRFASVEVRGRLPTPGLFAPEPPRVRVELRDARGATVGRPAIATYGFEEATGDVQLRPSEGAAPAETEPAVVTLLLTEERPASPVRFALLDADTGAELASSDPLEVTISV